GMLLLARGLVAPRPPLAAALARLRASSTPTRRGSQGWLTGRIGAPLADALRTLGIGFAGLRADLAVVGRSLEAQVGMKVGVAAFGAALVPAMAAVMAVGGVVLPP